jgi:hypothetical protein
VRAVAVVVVPPLGYQDLSFVEGGEDFAVQEFILELAVKGFDITILLGTTRFDEERLDLEALLVKPPSQ